MMWQYWGGYGWWMWIGMALFWIVVVGLIVAVVVWLANSGAGGRFGPPRQESPEDILKRRYARGEIDDEEYHRRLEELRRS